MAAPASAQLVSAITANQTVFGIQNIVTPAGSVGFPAVGVYANPQQPLLIDSELMYIVLQPVAGTLQVRSRGAEGTLAGAHDALANIATGLATDFGPNPAGSFTFLDSSDDPAIALGTTPQTLVLPTGNTNYNINTATAGTFTLSAPLASQNGLVIAFTSNTPNAHVLSAPSLFMDGTGTLPHSTCTFPSKQGVTVTLMAENGFWNVQANNGPASFT